MYENPSQFLDFKPDISSDYMQLLLLKVGSSDSEHPEFGVNLVSEVSHVNV